MLLDEDDHLLIESPAYVGSLAFLKPLGCNLIGICYWKHLLFELETDSNGLVPEKLDAILRNWDTSKKKPRVLYTVPTGGNPTGYSCNFDRKQRIYDIAQKHDLIILEDDPYYYLQVDSMYR